MSDAGADRYHAKREAGIPAERRDGSFASALNDAQSAAAEDFAARCFGAAANLEVYASHGDEGYDFKLGDAKVDVKWLGLEGETLHPRYRGHLILNPYDRRCDLYIVVVGSTARGFSLLGFASHANVKQQVANFGYGQKFALHTDYLQPFFKLDDTIGGDLP